MAVEHNSPCLYSLTDSSSRNGADFFFIKIKKMVKIALYCNVKEYRKSSLIHPFI